MRDLSGAQPQIKRRVFGHQRRFEVRPLRYSAAYAARYLINSDKQIADYKYPHDFGGWVEQAYMSEAAKFYESKGIGFEKTLDEWLARLRKEKIDIKE